MYANILHYNEPLTPLGKRYSENRRTILYGENLNPVNTPGTHYTIILITHILEKIIYNNNYNLHLHGLQLIVT